MEAADEPALGTATSSWQSMPSMRTPIPHAPGTLGALVSHHLENPRIFYGRVAAAGSRHPRGVT